MKNWIEEMESLNLELVALGESLGEEFFQPAEAWEMWKEETEAETVRRVEENIGPFPADLLPIIVDGVSKFCFSWQLVVEDAGCIHTVSGNLDVSGLGKIAIYLERAEGPEQDISAAEKADLAYLLHLTRDHGFLVIGTLSVRWIWLMVKFEGDTHSLHLYLNDRRPPLKLTVKLEEFMELAMRVRGISEFALYLTEEFPLQMERFRYTGFFEKVERLFPGTDLSPFRHRERCVAAESCSVRDGRLDFQRRTLEAFGKMPPGTTFQRWSPRADVVIFQDLPLTVWYHQLVNDVKFSDPLEAFYTMTQKLEVCWKVDGSVKGWFNFPRLQGEIFPNGHAPEYYGLSPDEQPHLAGKYVFYTDQYNDMLVQFEGDGRCTFHLLYLEADDYATHYITDDFDWLFTQLLNARGMYWWNYFLVFEPSAGDQRYLQFHRQMRAYFPEADMSLYPDPAGL